jgi:hypothetical protein
MLRMNATMILSMLWLAIWAPTAPAAEPVASTDGETPGLSIQVQELKLVSGGVLMLKFTVKNESDKAVDLYGTMQGVEGQTVDGIYLVDVPGKKKYLVVRDSENRCLCSREIARNLGQNASAAFWAKFPAPPDSVQKIGIVVPHFIPMDDVPISR